jgi:hypothetical protein
LQIALNTGCNPQKRSSSLANKLRSAQIEELPNNPGITSGKLSFGMDDMRDDIGEDELDEEGLPAIDDSLLNDEDAEALEGEDADPLLDGFHPVEEEPDF